MLSATSSGPCPSLGPPSSLGHPALPSPGKHPPCSAGAPCSPLSSPHLTALQLSPPVDKGHPKSRAMLCLFLGWSMAYNQHLIIAKGVALFIVTVDFAFSGNRLPHPFCARLLALSLVAVSSQARTRLLSCILPLTHDSRPLPLLYCTLPYGQWAASWSSVSPPLAHPS